METDVQRNAAAVAASTRNPVRWPFRIFAALIFLIAAAALAASGYVAWSEGRALLAWQLLASLPGALWFIRFSAYAAIHGRSPPMECWPFASQRLLGCYMLVWIFVLLRPFGE